MSIANLFNPNNYNLFCNSINVASSEIISGNVTINGNLSLPIALTNISMGVWTGSDNLQADHLILWNNGISHQAIGLGVTSGNFNIIGGTASINQYVGGALVCSANGGTANFQCPLGIAFNSPYDANHTLAKYENTSFAFTASGALTGSYTLFLNKIGNQVILTSKAAIGGASVATAVITLSTLPASYIPLHQSVHPIWQSFNSTPQVGSLVVNTNGTLVIALDPSGAPFTVTLPVSIQEFCIIYTLD